MKLASTEAWAAFPRIPLRSIQGYYRWSLRGQIIALAIEFRESHQGVRIFPALGMTPKMFHVEHFPLWADFPKCSTWNIGTLTPTASYYPRG